MHLMENVFSGYLPCCVTELVLPIGYVPTESIVFLKNQLYRLIHAYCCSFYYSFLFNYKHRRYDL